MPIVTSQGAIMHTFNTASYWASFCAFVVSWCNEIFALPNMVMEAAIIVPVVALIMNQYWRYREDRRAEKYYSQGIDRRKMERREDE